MAEEIKGKILKQYGNVIIYQPENKNLPIYTLIKEEKKESPYWGLKPFIEDDDLEDITYNGPNKRLKVYHRDIGFCDTNVFISEEEIKMILRPIASYSQRKIDALNPLFDGRTEDGSRVNATMPPVSIDGPTMTIRKFFKKRLTIVDLIRNGTLNFKVTAFLWMCIEGVKYKPCNIIISGGTGSGKTTTLNILAIFVPPEERIITIEDTAELQLMHEHWVRLETVMKSMDRKEVIMDDLLKNCLRMRPDRIIVGEIRGEEASTLFTAMNTGHNGCMGTIHANTASETITRITSPPMNVPPIMLNGLDLIIMQQRVNIRGKGTIRRITEISEIAGMEKDRPRLNTIFQYDIASNTLKETGVPSKLREKISTIAGISLKEFDELLAERQRLLEEIFAKPNVDVDYITKSIQDYYFRKEMVRKIKG